jgi:N-acetylglutamate synthase-like GNAT family acetyltransferase
MRAIGKQTPILIVPAVPEDRPAIVALIRGVLLGSGRDVNISEFWVAKDGDKVVGCVGMIPHGEDAEILIHGAVLKSYRRRGIAAKTIQVCLEAARARGKKFVAFCTVFWNLRLFRKFGFETCKRRELPESLRNFHQFTSFKYFYTSVMILRL